MPPSNLTTAATPAGTPPTSRPEPPKPRGAGGSWPTYELRERDFETFCTVAATLGGGAERPLTRRSLQALLEPGSQGIDAAGASDCVVERQYFTVKRNGVPTGRLAAHFLAEGPGGRAVDARGFFGLLAGEADLDGMAFLFDMASDWLATRGCRTLVGNVRPDVDLTVDPWLTGTIDDVPTHLRPCLEALGLGASLGASLYGCAVPPRSAKRPVFGSDPEPGGVAWAPLHPRAPWRGVQGTLAGEVVARVECSPSTGRGRWSLRSTVGRARGTPPAGPVELARFHVVPRLRDRGLGTRLCGELMRALRTSGVHSLVVGPVHDGHVAARRILNRLSAQRLRRVQLFAQDL